MKRALLVLVALGALVGCGGPRDEALCDFYMQDNQSHPSVAAQEGVDYWC